VTRNKFFHFGVAVRSIEETASALSQLLGGRVVGNRRVDHEYLGLMVGVKNASAEIAMFETSSGEFIELLSWTHEVEKDIAVESIVARTTTHICFYVENIEICWENALRFHSLFILSHEIITVPMGPNQGCKVFFVKVNNEFYIELFERATTQNSVV